MAKKHFDNKNDLLAELKRRKSMADNCVSATYTMYMMMACSVLLEDFEYDSDTIENFLAGFSKRFDAYERGELTVDSMDQNLKDAGIYVELPVLV